MLLAVMLLGTACTPTVKIEARVGLQGGRVAHDTGLRRGPGAWR